MKKVVPIVFLTAIFLAACGATKDKSSDTADEILDQDIFTQAVNTNNPDRCKDIINKDVSKECAEVVEARQLTEQAMNSLSDSKCESIKIKRYKEECGKSVVEAKKASDQQESAIKEQEKNNQITLEIEQKAINDNDYTVCDEIADENQQYSCKYNVLANQAAQKNDLSLCKEIGRDDLILRCKDGVTNKNK